MIKATKVDNHVLVEVEGTGKQVFSEMCLLFSELRKQHKELYLGALKYARLTNQKESEEDA